MRPFHTRRLVVALALAPLVTACVGSGGSRRAGSAPKAPSAASGTAAASSAELEALYRARMDSATMNVSDADIDFMTGMISHHAQALVMSAWAPSHGAGASVRTLTSRIVNAQKDEIATMQQWLRDRRLPVPEVDDAGRVTISSDGQGPLRTPGMLNTEQMRELEAARGAEFDHLFLTHMIQHHKGAVTMVHNLFDTNGAAQDDLVFKIASDIQVDQITEMARMQRLLEKLPARDSNR